MKRQKKIFSFLLLIILAASIGACAKKGDWAVKIDDEVITIDEFYSYYYTQNSILLNKTKKEVDELADDKSIENHPTLNKNNFLDYLISRKLLYRKAFNDEAINKKDLEKVTEIFTLQGVATYYLTKKFKDDISVTDDEIDKFYKNNPKIFRGVPINDDVINKIRQQLFMQKFEQKSSEFVMELIAESQINREGFQKYIAQQNEEKTGDNKSNTKQIDTDKLAVKIDDEKITIGEFLDYYYLQNKILLNMEKDEIDKISEDPSMADHPTLNKTKFMDFIISRKLLYKKTINDESLDQEELKTIIELFKLQGVSSYYLSLKLKDKITVTDDEIDRFYKENKKIFKGVPINDDVINRIKQQIYMQKFEQESSQFIMNLLAESKVNREGFRNHIKKKLQEKEAAASEESKKPASTK